MPLDVGTSGSPLRGLGAALLVAPLVTPAVFVLLKGMSTGFDRSQGGVGFAKDVLLGFLMFSVFAYSAAIVLGLPMYWYYRRRQIRSIPAYALGGFVIGFTTLLLTSMITGGLWGADFTLIAFARTSAVMIVCGGLSGVVFRLLAPSAEGS